MDLKSRLMRYLIGIMIGLILVFVFFGKRSCTDWMPNQRVLETLSSQDLIISARGRCEMNCLNLSDTDLVHLIKSGDVNFSESSTRTSPKVYKIEANRPEDELEYSMQFEVKDSSSVLISASVPGKTCNCP
jgi:hypothetical protein